MFLLLTLSNPQERSVVLKWTIIDGTCNKYCGGFTTEIENLDFDNCPNMVGFTTLPL